MLESYLQDLAKASRSLSESEVRLVVAEARAHLEEAIQAHIELGLSLEDAEQEAIAAFGQPVAIAAPSFRAIVDRRQRLGTIFAALFLLGFVPPTVLWSLPIQPGWLLLFLVARYAHACWIVRRPTNLSLAIASFTALFGPTMYVVGISNGGFGHACRQLLYEWPRKDLSALAWYHPNWEWIPYAQGAVETAYEWRFLLGTLLLATAGVDFFFGAAGALITELRRRRPKRDRGTYV